MKCYTPEFFLHRYGACEKYCLHKNTEQSETNPPPLSSVHLWDQESKSFEAVQFGNGRNVKINNSI